MPFHRLLCLRRFFERKRLGDMHAKLAVAHQPIELVEQHLGGETVGLPELNALGRRRFGQDAVGECDDAALPHQIQRGSRGVAADEKIEYASPWSSRMV